MKAAPGPRGMPVIGVAPMVAREPYRYWRRMADEHGDVVSVPLPGMNLIVINHPDHVRHVTTTKAKRYYSKPRYIREALTELPQFPTFTFARDHEDWKPARKALTPRFSQRSLDVLAPLILDQISSDLEPLARCARTGERFDLQRTFHRLTMSVMLRVMFSTPPEAERIDASVEALEATMRTVAWRMMFGRAPRWLPLPSARSGRRASAFLVEYIDRMVAERRRNPIEGSDLLNILLELHDADGAAHGEDQLRADVRGMLIGGYETTAAAMSWTVAFLGANPPARARVYEEVDALGSRPVGIEDIERLAWIRACFDEAQRLQGNVLNGRDALQDDEIGGYRIPEGATVGYSAYALGRDPRFWRDPDRFDPSRWLGEEEVNTYAFLPFGVGPHMCIGKRMAYMVAQFTLATFMQRFAFRTPDGYRPEHHFNFGNPVKGGVPVTLASRLGLDSQQN